MLCEPLFFDNLKHKIFSYFHYSTKVKIKNIKIKFKAKDVSQTITSVAKKCSDVMTKINYRDPHTMPLGELYRLTGGWDGVREALGITMCTLSYKDKCEQILRKHSEKQGRMQAECAISNKRDRKKIRIVQPSLQLSMKPF